MSEENNTLEQQPLNPPASFDQERLRQEGADWYARWRNRIKDWLDNNVDSNLATLIMMVPDFFILIIDLLRDQRVPLSVKAQLAIAAAYVMSPFDFLPEAVLGVIGLADDAGIMALALYSIANLRKVDPQVIRDHWRGEGDVMDSITSVYALVEQNAEKFMGTGIWDRIKKRFSGDAKRHTETE